MIFDAATPPTGTVKDWLDHHADGAQIAIVFPETGDALTWRALRDEARALAEGLTGLGIAQGESVAIVHPNGRDGAIALYAALYGGFRATMINLAAGPDAIAYALDHSGARFFCVLPIYHINGLCVTMMGALVSGGSLAMTPRFSASKFWDQAAMAEITWFSVVPTIISHLLHNDANPSASVRTRLRFGRSASSALAVETQTAFEQRFDVPIVETMGLTETAAQILSNPLPPGIRKIGSPGVGFGNEVCILTPELTPAPPLQEGEIAVRGPNVMLEYLNNPEATAKTFTGDWLRTGDLGHIDEDGYVFVTGRLKELIIKGGENIAPREIDEVLYSQPDIIEAAAFARPCKSYGETVEAAVSVKPGSDLSEAALIALCQERLGKFKAPDCIHFLPELPKGPSGKIQRLKLAALV